MSNWPDTRLLDLFGNWPDTRLLDLFGIQQPIIQGPMAGATTLAMMVGVAKAGGLGSLPAAMLTPEQIRQQTEAFRRAVQAPLNINFFCHQPPTPDPEREKRWKERLAPYYREQGLDFNAPTPVSSRAPFDETSCQLVEELRPEIVLSLRPAAQAPARSGQGHRRAHHWLRHHRG